MPNKDTSKDTFDFDFFVIGAGSGGVRAARMAAKTGARVAVCEDSKLGGTCVNLGCVPKKLFSYATHYGEDAHDAATYGWDVQVGPFNWETFLAAKDKEIGRLNTIYGRILGDAGVEVIRGRGQLLDAHRVRVGDKTYQAKHILVATGGRPFKPDIPGADLGITSDQFFHLKTQPARCVVIGGGYIGVELACILHGLGTKTSLVYRGDMLLRGFDNDIRSFLAEQMRAQGMDVHFECDIAAVRPSGDALTVEFKDHDEVETDVVLFATGRVPNTAGLGLDAAGVQLNARGGAIKVDKYYRTNVPSIFAIGDVIDEVNLTPVALAQGMAVVCTLFKNEPQTVDLTNVPTAVFSSPNVGTVGLTESEARNEGYEIVVYKSSFTPMRHTITGRKEKSLMKLIVDKASDRVLGCHMVGPDAGELVQGLGIALKCGATKTQFDSTIGIHPTAAEEWVTMREPVRAPDPADD